MLARNSNPFLYPKFRHTRRQKPKRYKTNRSFKPYVRREFEQKCIYCRRPDSFHPHDSDSFAVEHYLPAEHFPNLEFDYDNLFYACLKCNSFKEDYYPKTPYDPFIPNPCAHTMMEHVRAQHGEVVALSSYGAFMRDTFFLNADEVVEYRKSTVTLIGTVESDIKEMKKLAKQVAKSNVPGAMSDLEELQSELSRLQALHSRLCGTTLTP